MSDSATNPHIVFDWNRLHRITDTAQRTTGTIKRTPDDFLVEEVPLYEASGEGEHVYLLIEKRDVTGSELGRHIRETVGVGSRDIGMAGLKDRRAVTRQWVSLPISCADKIPAIETDLIKILDQRLHTNKLRSGHLKGNRFHIKVRDTHNDAALADVLRAAWEPAIEALRTTGLPNYFGEQRFGNYGDTAVTGMALLLPDAFPKTQTPRSHHARRFTLSAVQSAIFNSVLAKRITAGTFTTVLDGDIARLDKSHAIFTVESADIEQIRYEMHDIVMTGPMWGIKMPKALGETGKIEEATLAEFGLQDRHFIKYRKLVPGTRRPLRIVPQDLKVEVSEDSCEFSFFLPAGSYATVLLREFMNSWTYGIPKETPATGPSTEQQGDAA